MYPVLTQAVRGETRSVSKPYYNFFLHSFGLPLLLLMGIGPLVAWRRASLRALGKTFLVPAIAAVADRRDADRARLSARRRPGCSRTRSARSSRRRSCSSSCAEHARVTRSPAARGSGALAELVGRNRRRYGGYIIHASILMLAIGIAGSSAYQTVRERGLHPGQSMEVAGYTLTYQQLQTAAGGERGRDARGRRRDARRLARHDAAPGQERLPGRAAGVERGVDLPRSAQHRRSVHDRRPDRPEVARAVPEGAREAARQPHLGRRASCSCSARSSRCGRTPSSSGSSRSATRRAPSRHDHRARAGGGARGARRRVRRPAVHPRARARRATGSTS